MENIVLFDILNPLFGKLELDDTLESLLNFGSPGFEVRHWHVEDDEQVSLGSKLLNVSSGKADLSLNSTHGESGSNKVQEENDKAVRSCLREIDELNKKVADKDVIINKLKEQNRKLIYENKKFSLEIRVKTLQMGLLHKQNIYVKGQTNLDGSNGVSAEGCIIENGVNKTLLIDRLTATHAASGDNVTSTVMQHRDLLIYPQKFVKSETKVADKSVYGLDGLFCGSSLSAKSWRNDFVHQPSSYPNQKLHGKVMTTSCKYECLICHKYFASKGSLKIHDRIHADERPYPCCICKRSFSQRGNLKEHISRKHKYSLDNNQKTHFEKPGSQEFRCYFCLQNMESKQFYYKHISRFHVDMLPKIK